LLDVNCIDQTWRRNWKIHENDTVPLPCLQVYLWPRLTLTLTSWPRSEISCPCHVGHLCANLHQNQLFTFKIFIHKFGNKRTDGQIKNICLRLSICPLLLCLYRRLSVLYYYACIRRGDPVGINSDHKECCHNVWYEKPEWFGYSTLKKVWLMYLVVSTQ